MNPFTLNGRKAGGAATGFGTTSTKPVNGAAGGTLLSTKTGGSTLLNGGISSGLAVPGTSGSALSSLNGDKTP